MSRLLPFVIAGTTALAATVYLVLAGARAGAPSVFVVLTATSLSLTVYLLVRSGLSLVREPDGAEAQIATGRRRKELEREKQALLKALKELEFDHEMGKVSDGDYADIAARYRGRALQVMKRLDDGRADLRKIIVRDVAERQRRLGAGEAAEAVTAASPIPAQSVTPAPPEPLPAPTTLVAAPLAAARACDRCRTTNDEDAVFCKKCGARVDGGGAS